MKQIYLDNAATTPVDQKVFEAMKPYFSDKFGNASSIHSYGQEARAAIDASRQTIANFLNCQPIEVIFTSGGSESDNLAITGLIAGITNNQSPITNQIPNSNSEKANKPTSYKLLPHIITSAFEHHAVIDTIRELEREGRIEATYVQSGNDGIITAESIDKAIKENTVLVSIMYVNNEIGTLQPIREIGKLIEKINLGRTELMADKGHLHGAAGREPEELDKIRPLIYDRIYFHTDAVQATEYFNMDVKYLHVDMLTISAHKIYGPKGVGALFVKKGTPLKHQIIGGGQEYKMRAGTENVAGIVGLAEAIELANSEQRIANSNNEEAKSNNLKLKKLRDRLIDGIEERISDVHLNGSRELRSPANVNVSFHNAEGESILLNLDALGIAASSGSACTSGSLEPSHVLLALGHSAEEAHGSIRFTLGRDTTEADIDRVLEVLPGIIEKLRKMSPYK